MPAPTPQAPQPGNEAPDFELTADDGSLVRLSDLRGSPVILFFYPKALTSGCTVQAQGFRDAAPALAEHGAIVLGISPDPVSRLAAFRDKDQLNFKLLSDPDHAVADKYGAWGKKSMYGREYDGILRSHFVIDAQGKVIAAEVKVAPAASPDLALGALKSV